MPPKRTRCVGRKPLNLSKQAEKRKVDEHDEIYVQDVQTTSQSTGRNGRKTRKGHNPDLVDSSSTEGITTSPRSGDQCSLQGECVRMDSQEPPRSPTPPPEEITHRDQSYDKEDDNILSQPQPKPVVEKGSKGQGKRQAAVTVSGVPSPLTTHYNFTEAQEEDIAKWIKSKPQVYDMKNKAYTDKGARRKLWEDKGSEYGVTYDVICKWYYTQRTRFSKLSEGQPKEKCKKRSGDGYDSGEETNALLEEASENDSHRDAFIRRIFAFLRGHIRRFKEKLALAETGELPPSDDDSVITCAGLYVPSQPSKKYSGLPTSRGSRIKKATVAAKDRPESPTMDMRMKETSADIQDRLVQYITRDTPETRSSPFCRYLESDLDKLHETCWEPVVQDITDVLRHYQKISRQLRFREAQGEVVSRFEEVSSAFQHQQQRPVPVLPMSPAATHQRISHIQRESVLPTATAFSANMSTSSPSAMYQPPPQPVASSSTSGMSGGHRIQHM